MVDQRKILAEVYGDRSVTDIPQLWTLCEPTANLHSGVRLIKPYHIDKEVQAYYEDGMRVPEDVTLLWADDKYA